MNYFAETNYILETSDGRLNYIGAVIKYFMIMYGNPDNYKEETRELYAKRYKERIFKYFNPNIAIEDIEESFYKNVLNRLSSEYSLSDSSIYHLYNSLIYTPVDVYFSDKSNHTKNPLIANTYKFIESNKKKDIEEAFHRIPRKLTIEQFKNAVEYLFANIESENGGLPAIALMLFLGVRLNEAAGASFGDINNLLNTEKGHYITILQTTQINTNKTKIGGKTKNAIRRIILIDKAYEYFEKRKKFIESVVIFPTKDKIGKTIESINDMPIGCRNNRYTDRIATIELSVIGKEFLFDVLKMSVKQVSGLNALVDLKHEFEDIKDPTTYILRRNWLTNLALCGATPEQIEYWAGHKMEDSDISRGMYGSNDNMIKLYSMVQNHPISGIDTNDEFKVSDEYCNFTNKNELSLSFEKDGTYTIVVKNKVLNDDVNITCDNKENWSLISIPNDDNQDETVNITKQFKDAFKNHARD